LLLDHLTLAVIANGRLSSNWIEFKRRWETFQHTAPPAPVVQRQPPRKYSIARPYGIPLGVWYGKE
jgi:hypothetical protein